jgi:hypothetical protein
VGGGARPRRGGRGSDLAHELLDDVQLAGEEALLRLAAGHLAAGGARQRAGADEHQLAQLHAELLGDGDPGLRVDLLVAAGFVAPLHLVDEDQPRPVVALVGERRPAAGLEQRRRDLHHLLDVLRVVVAAADDEHVLQPAGDEQLAFVEEAQVAGPQPALGGVVGQGAAEGRLGGVGPLEVARRDARAAHPHFAYGAVG